MKTLIDKSLEYSSWVHELGKTETEKSFCYSTEKALERIANDPALDRTKESFAEDLIDSSFAAVSDYNGQPNAGLRQDLIYALRTAAEIIGPSGTKKRFHEFGLEQIREIVEIYNCAVESAHDRGSRITSIAVDSYNPATEKEEIKIFNLDKEKKLVA